ncbi:alpha-L-fucosidase [Pedobacter westerhofensis]|uniref:alpha-L-fucosidase n=1 Tax=Pedobacter westerhofensis TaxID=425512 RepID=A0A521D9W9_9SPHI|nr:alpha-L-fucosidase [Pedobacter westerhofensis]SMO68468.1 alpha-L-fucosidase [Pedobacter westerhofensis]
MKIVYITLALCFFYNFSFSQNDVVNDDEGSSYNLNKPEREEWLRNTGAGLFIHFNVDAQLGVVISHSLVGASNDYVDRYFNDLPKTFNPSKFNPKEIAELAKMAGMKYICFTTKHHAGFCFWDTKTTDFNITKTPYKKDMLKEFVDATREAGLDVGFYFSPEDFNFLRSHNIPISRTNVKMDAKTTKEYNDYNRKQCEELMTNYGKIDVFFIDGEPKEVVKETCWRIQPNLLITRGAIKTPEQALPGAKITQPWLSPITMGTAWQYQPTNDRYKTGTQLINLLIEARAKGGSLLLNVGPKPNGEMAIQQEDRLREMALWNFINHESMDSVRSWVVAKEDDIWFTKKGKNTVYAFVTDVADWKEGARKNFLLRSVKSTANTKISVLGQNSQIIEYKANLDVSCKYTQTADGLEVSVVKAQRIYDDHRWPNPVVIKLENIEPVFAEAVFVKTMGSTVNATGAVLKGQVVDYKPSLSKRARFYYRPYAGQVETLYASPWEKTVWVNINADGTFSVPFKGKKGSRVEYKAVAEQQKVAVEGETSVVSL